MQTQVTQVEIAAAKTAQEAELAAQRAAAALEKKRISAPGELEANPNVVRSEGIGGLGDAAWGVIYVVMRGRRQPALPTGSVLF